MVYGFMNLRYFYVDAFRRLLWFFTGRCRPITPVLPCHIV